MIKKQPHNPAMGKSVFLTALFLIATANFAFGQKAYELDYLIQNALVYNGTNQKPTQKVVGIHRDKIVYVGEKVPKLKKKLQIIDAEGLYLAPGFIDPHTHNDRWLGSENAEERANKGSLAQGVTTVFLGNDGFGGYQIANELDKYNKLGIGTNIAHFIGFSGVRIEVLQNEDVRPNAEQLEDMKRLVQQGMEEGAFGLSTGLYYAPQSYSSTSEVVALAQVVKDHGGIYDTHMRSESDELVKAVQETIEIGEQTGIPLMISHIKALGPAAWGKSQEVIDLIEEKQEQGITIFASQYPYEASHTSLKAMLIPRWAQVGGDEKMVERLEAYETDKKLQRDISKNLAIRGGDTRIRIAQTKDASIAGKDLHTIANEWKLSPEETAVAIIKREPGTSGVSFSMDEEDIENFIKKDWVLTGSDGGGPHPRAYGTFARKIRKYVWEDQILSMEEAIHRATGKSADLLGLKNRGYIREGYYADLVLFDPDTYRDEATFEEPRRLAEGVKYVFVNGIPAIADYQFTGKLGGKAINFRKQ